MTAYLGGSSFRVIGAGFMPAYKTELRPARFWAGVNPAPTVSFLSLRVFCALGERRFWWAAPTQTWIPRSSRRLTLRLCAVCTTGQTNQNTKKETAT